MSTDTQNLDVSQLDGWDSIAGAIQKTYAFETFAHALMFVNAVGFQAEQADHHPDIDIRYRKVTCTLVTHSEGKVTEKDLQLAGIIEGLFSE